MSERIAYILGAGFSAPLGIPTMKDLLFKAKDLHATQPERFAHFAQVFREIDAMARVKNYCASDLFNIEEVLSILEMEVELGHTVGREAFVTFIRDTVVASTPPFDPPPDAEALNFGETLVTRHYMGYCAFVASLFRAVLTSNQTRTAPCNRGRYSIEMGAPGSTRYAVITLNYDAVLENACLYLGAVAEGRLEFVTRIGDYNAAWERAPYLAKLHGSVLGGSIVPPTWSKGVTADIREAWQLAHSILVDATELRFIGYSLPLADAYVKYLLKAAMRTSHRLKRVVVIGLDPDGTVRQRYADMLTFPNWGFANLNVSGYLTHVGYSGQNQVDPPIRHVFDQLEQAHAVACIPFLR